MVVLGTLSLMVLSHELFGKFGRRELLLSMKRNKQVQKWCFVWLLKLRRNGDLLTPPAPSFGNRSSKSWQPPTSGVLKCNIGVSWNETQSISGAFWLLRDHNGAVLLHSRRAFSGVSSHMEAELLGFHFAVESMRSTHQWNIIFESHYTLARDALLNPAMFPRLRLVINEILSFLPCLQTWQMTYACEARNLPATKIAESVVRDRRFSSYIERGGPSWLLANLNAEAVSN